jgi:hypothetical protein
MISDVLSETVASLDRYLNEPDYNDTYEGELRSRIVSLRNAAERIRIELDTPPTDNERYDALAKRAERNTEAA